MPDLRAAAFLAVVLLSLVAAPDLLLGQQGGAVRGLIVIDAGHGGDDDGARGPTGLREKDVTLAVARALAHILDLDPHLEVRLTRDRDTLIALADRPRMANRWRAETDADRPALFLSVHANAHASRSVRGVETYFLAEALTEEARAVAARENSAGRFDGAGEQGDPLSFIFRDLRQNRYLHESSAWAERIQRALAREHPGPDRGVKQAGFVVLNGAFMPAVLLEVGFISNPVEERMLADPDAQRALAARIATAIRAHFPAATLGVPATAASGSEAWTPAPDGG